MPSAALLSADPHSEVYEDVRKLLYKVVHHFQSRFGGDFDELMSQANLHYQKAFVSYDPAMGRFSKRVAYNVWYGLLDTARVRMRRDNNASVSSCEQEVLNEVPEGIPGRVEGIVREVSEDARIIIQTVLGWQDRSVWHGIVRRKQARNVRKALVEFLIDLGWSGDRIMQCMCEIKEALCDADED